MEGTPRTMRLHIGIFGRANVGKSSFLNLITGQDVSIVSPRPGTTTDVVEKAMELRPVGPVVFLDTAGVDDSSSLSSARLGRTAGAFRRADIFVVVTAEGRWGGYEEGIVKEARERGAPVAAVVNRTDEAALSEAFRERLLGVTPYVMSCSCVDGTDGRDGGDGGNDGDDGEGGDGGGNGGNDGNGVGALNCPARTLAAARGGRGGELAAAVEAFREIMISCAAGMTERQRPLLDGLIRRGGLAVLVVPVDRGAPKGRLILPQAQAIRDILDAGGLALTVGLREYAEAPLPTGMKPDIVICDSQIVKEVLAHTPPDVKCTTFSILFARQKGDLAELARGTSAIGSLKDGDKILIAEACSHHASEDDIGRVKIPRLLRERTGRNPQIDFCSGRDYPKHLEQYSLIIHCGACMLTRSEMLRRIKEATDKQVPITNYGIAISYLQGVFERVTQGEALHVLRGIA